MSGLIELGCFRLDCCPKPADMCLISRRPCQPLTAPHFYLLTCLLPYLLILILTYSLLKSLGGIFSYISFLGPSHFIRITPTSTYTSPNVAFLLTPALMLHV